MTIEHQPRASESFGKVAHARHGWQSGGAQEWSVHTVDSKTADQLVTGYLHFLERVAGVTARPGQEGIDLGCGAGYISRAFVERGLRMTASEYGPDAVALVRARNPGLEIRDIDMATFLEPERFDLIFSREVYLVTRINAYDEQVRVISNIIDSLRPGGVFLLVGSDVAKPNCMDYDRVIAKFRNDPRISLVTDKHYEILFKRLSQYIHGPASYRLLASLAAPAIAWRKMFKRWASIYMIAFVKR